MLKKRPPKPRSEEKSGAVSRVAVETTTVRLAIAGARPRVFKTRAFAKDARDIPDEELCEAMRQLWEGKGDDLGGGVWKKRLNGNRDRSIVLAKGRKYWVYTHLYAKSDQANITEKELAAFRTLAKIYDGLKVADVKNMLDAKSFIEICHECKS